LKKISGMPAFNEYEGFGMAAAGRMKRKLGEMGVKEGKEVEGGVYFFT
jgi:Fe2+ transport system protein FeoA